VHLLAVATDGWRQRTVARPAADGSYETVLTVPGTGVYYVSFAVPSLRVTFNDRQPAIVRAAAGRP
jgi:hypothetical protein